MDKELKHRLSQCCAKLHTVASQLHTMTVRSGSQSPRVSPSTSHDALSGVMADLVDVSRELRPQGDVVTSRSREVRQLADVFLLLFFSPFSIFFFLFFENENFFQNNAFYFLSRILKST